MKNKIRDFILKTIAVIFSILFAIVLFNTIFFNKTIGINYKIPVIIIFTIIVYGIILFLYYIYTKKEMKFLDYSPKKIYYFIFIAIIFIVQFIIAKLVYGEYGWDCGEIIKDSYLFTNNGYFNFPYYAQYPNNIGIFLIINKVLEISKNFIDIKIIENCFLSSIVFNIIMVDLASLFTFLTIKKVSGNKSAYLSLMFILPLMIFSPYINIPYTDTISMMFPILILYLYICIKELPKEKFQKYLLALLMGIVTVVGTLLKPTVIIMPIAIFIISILNINKVGLKNIAYTLILCVFFIVGVGFSYLGYSVQKEKFFNELISEEMSYDLEISYMHFLMMGMQEKPNDTKEDGKNQIEGIDRISLDDREHLKILYKKERKFGNFKNFEFVLTGTVLSSLNKPYIIDFGAGHSIYEDEILRSQMKKMCSQFKNIILLLPSKDKAKSREILAERRKIKLGSHKDQDNWHFITAENNYEIATNILYEENKTPEDISREIMKLVRCNQIELGNR